MARSDAQRAKEIMEEHKEAIGCKSVELNDQIAKVMANYVSHSTGSPVAASMPRQFSSRSRA